MVAGSTIPGTIDGRGISLIMACKSAAGGSSPRKTVFASGVPVMIKQTKGWV